LETSVTLNLIRKAQYQIVAGTQYYLLISVIVSGTSYKNYNVVILKDLNGGYTLKSAEVAPPTPSCPYCASMVIIQHAPGCYGGPLNGCNCCMNTGEMAITSTEPIEPPGGAKLCTTLSNGHRTCRTFGTLDQCTAQLNICKAQSNKQWLCGKCIKIKS